MHQIAIQELPALCSPLAGGHFAGLFFLDGKLYANIVASIAGELSGPWNQSMQEVTGALSYTDGLANTEAMVKAGSKLAIAARAARIGDLDDWHIGARDIVELTYRHLKPTEYTDWQFRSGDNPSSVPPGYPYTEQSPIQTIATGFQEGGEDALQPVWHWTSTQSAASPDYAWMQDFANGYQDDSRKSNEYRVRLVRRILVIE